MKASIVNVTVKLVVFHDEDQDPCDVVNECDYNFEVIPNSDNSKIVSQEITDCDDLGECDPDSHVLLEEHRRDQKRGLGGDTL